MRFAGDVLGMTGLAPGMLGAVGIVDLLHRPGRLGLAAESLGRPVRLLLLQVRLMIAAPAGLMRLELLPLPELGGDLATP